MKKLTYIVLFLFVAMFSLVGCFASQQPEESAAAVAAPTLIVATSTEAIQSTAVPDTVSEQLIAVEPVENTKINLNDMTEEQLLNTIPNFSTRMVREFFEYAPYVSIQQFRREIGKYVDESQVTMYEEYVYVPIDINESDAATIEQIPGLNAAIAEALIAERPFDSVPAFLTKLAELAPAVDGNIAAGYLN